MGETGDRRTFPSYFCFLEMAGTTRLELATSAVTGISGSVTN